MSDGAAGQRLPAIYLRGMLMGAADIVPGVSGGTIAFITGIYDRLLGAISAFDLDAIRLLRGGRLAALWTHVDGAFLLVLGAGILTSIALLSRLITTLLVEQPLLLWSFFFGLILGSALLLLRRVDHWRVPALAGILLGAVAAAVIGLSPALSLPVAAPSFFLAGFVAICAMILPGISGSFILVLLGMYAPVLEAVESFDLPVLLLFALGAGSGLLVFARALHWLLATHHGTTLATLTGFLAGSLLVVWPWKIVGGSSSIALPVLPGTFAAAGGQPQVLACIALMALGLAAVALLEWRWGGPEH